jgi:hypothetical protein
MFIYLFPFFSRTDIDYSDNSTQDDTSDSDYGEEENEIENDIFILAAATVEFVENYYMPYIAKEPCKTSSQTGYKWVMEILQGNPDRCKISKFQNRNTRIPLLV